VKPQRRAPEQKTRTREDRATALCMRLVMASPERVDELIGGHTAETFAKSHNLPVGLIRSTFQHAVERSAGRG
jgi:hypothetical protein